MSPTLKLSPSQRVRLLKEISVRLSKEEWPMLDMTLSQFGVRTSQEGPSDKEAYILEIAKSAPDDVLTSLGEHLDFSLQVAPSSEIAPAYWRPGMFRLFISHISPHKKFASELQEGLAGYGISGFVAHEDIEPAAEWQDEIEIALRTADGLVALLHPGFHESNWTDQEIGIAMGRGIPAFSVRLGQDPYGFIGRFQAFAGKAADELAREMFDTLGTHKQTKKKMATAVISLFEGSDTFEEAKLRLRFVEELDVWEPSFATRLEAAVKSNSQIRNAWHVPEGVQRVLEKRASH